MMQAQNAEMSESEFSIFARVVHGLESRTAAYCNRLRRMSLLK